MLSKETQEKIEVMLAKIKAMEGDLGKDKVKYFTKHTLRAYVKKRVITEEEYAEYMQKLGY